MITLSVIVTARNVQGHLRECLNSALAPSSGDGAALEIIAVNNGSNDRTGAILDEYATRDGRVRTLHLPQPLASGAARDAGAMLAQGSHLLFLEGRDALTPGALASLTARFGTAEEPDVLVFDHVRAQWWNSALPSSDRHLLSSVDPATFSLADRAKLLHVTPMVANRLLSAAFYRGHRELFDQDEFQEVLPALGSILVADRIAVLDTICLRRHQLPHSAALDTANSYFNLFAQYEALMGLLASYSASEQLHSTVFNGMVNRYLAVFSSSRLPAQARAEFLRRASDHFTRFRPSEYRRPGGSNGLRHAVLESGSYTRYCALQTANRTRRGLQKAVGQARQGATKKALEYYYREQLGRPLAEDLAVFSAYWHRGVRCNPAAISAKLAELAPSVRQVWVVRPSDAPMVPSGTDYVVLGTRRYWSVLARAKYLVNNVNFPNSFVKRSGQIYVQTHHGTPLKRMGTDQIAFPTTARGVDFEALLRRCRNWDYSVSANSHSTETWERAYPVAFTSLNYGYPRNDAYFTGAEDVRRIRVRLGIAPGKTALLYAPTHRDYEATWNPRLDLEALARRLGDDFVLLVRGHYYYDRGPSPLEKLHRRGVVIDVSGYQSVEELGLAADALITDYSSLMFDYANLDRPIVVLADDWETYSVTRGVYFDLTQLSPGPVAHSQKEVTELFLSGAWCGPEADAQRAEFRRRFCDYDDGHAAERVVQHVFLGCPNTPPIVPLEQRTPAPPPSAMAVLDESSTIPVS